MSYSMAKSYFYNIMNIINKRLGGEAIAYDKWILNIHFSLSTHFL